MNYLWTEDVIGVVVCMACALFIGLFSCAVHYLFTLGGEKKTGDEWPEWPTWTYLKTETTHEKQGDE